MIRIGQVYQNTLTHERFSVTWMFQGKACLSDGLAYTPGALRANWELIADVCESCRRAWAPEDIQSVPGPYGGSLDVCPDCRRDGLSPEPVSRAVPPREM